MKKTFTKHLFFLALLSIFTFTGVYAQTITVGNVDPGPFGQGSTIAVPITINDAAGCVNQGNTFNLYLSDASGSFASGGTLIGSSTGFYASFVNGVIPIGTLVGTGYKVIVKSTSPAVTSAPSTAFTINSSTAVTAGATSQLINVAYPDVYGQCSGSAGTPFTFNNSSSTGATTTATFVNEQTQTTEASNVSIPTAGYVFTANAANYTVIVKATTAAGTVGTHAYLLINNVIRSNLGATGNQTVCLVNGQGTLPVNIDFSSLAAGIQVNYPGTLYTITWGDGSAPTLLTFCQIKALNGLIPHTFTKASCGNNIVLQASNAFCGKVGVPGSNTASVVIPPTNLFKLPATACAGTPLTIDNLSDPGIDPATCLPSTKAYYTWVVDNTKYQNYPLTTPFILPATTPPGPHTITLQLQNTSGSCTAADVSLPICLQAPPQPIFTVPATACIANGPVTPVNTSVIDPGCNANNQYIWNVVGPAAVTYAGGTNANSQLPQFVFTTPGVYSVQLSITSASCGPVSTLSQAIIVDGTPVAKLSPDNSFCGNNQTLVFDPTPGSKTQTILTGTGQVQPTTYIWVITGGAFSFQNNTTANSQYPVILFSDYAAYTVQVKQTNNCGTVSSSIQTLTFVLAPTVTTSGPQAICASNPVAPLVGKIVGPYTSFQWTGGNGTFSAGRNSLITNYTPSATEIAAGQVTLTLLVTTALPAPCNQIPSNITINITSISIVTSPPAVPVCTGQPVNYAITANDPASTFTWTASVTSGTATGAPATGSGNTITDIITDTDPNNPATVKYIITPKNSGCTGNVFTLTVTVNPLPAITAIPQSPSICSIQPANIALTSNIANTSYTWTSVAAAGITGNTNQANGVVTTGIQDVLINNGAAPATVTYTITPYNGTCPGVAITASVVVQPLPVESKPGPDDEVCSTITYTLQGNDPSPGTGLWTQTAGPTAGVNITNPTNKNAVVTGLSEGNKYQFKWAITATPTCPSNSNFVNITIDKATIGGTTTDSGTGPVCSGNNAGQITLAGQQGNILRWESSIDNGATWQPIVNLSGTQTYSNLTQTTQYRAVTQSGVCLALPSTVTTITVNPPTVIADAGGPQGICNQTSTTLNGNDPAPFIGTWTQTAGPLANITDPTNPKSPVTGLVSGNIYTFLWTIKGLPPCGDSHASVNISASSDITASFTTDKIQGCGPTTVTFTNTSTPTTAGIFLWDFGDGSPTSNLVTPPPHTFAPSTDGKETDYTITLTPVGNCNLKTPSTVTIKVSPAIPVASLFPSQTSACGGFTLTAQNTSPGNNVSYDFYLTDKVGNPPLQHYTKTDKSDVVFQPINPTKPTDYFIYVIATDQCGNQNQPRFVTISASPSTVISLTQIKGDPQSVCLGNSITLQNISSGGDRFTYTIYDANKNPIKTIQAGLADFVYTPTAVGTYYVSITAGNNGCGDAPESPLKEFSVYPDPQPDFTYKLDNDYNVTFTNTTPDDGNTPASSLSYQWNFGDGSAPGAGFVPGVHHYDYEKSPFTVTLTATNPASGCLGVKTETVIVNFLGGLYLPNAFIPSSSNSQIQVFIAKGNSIKEWHMQIFNNFGQLVWETTKLDSNGSPSEGWDGTFKGAPAQQGVYVWQISATFINGTQWKGMSYNHSLPRRTGIINLIR